MMKMIKLPMVASLVILLSASLLSACGGSESHSNGKSSGGPVSEKYQGIWLSPAYGIGLKVNAGAAELFHYTTLFCLLEESDSISDEEIEASYRLNQGVLELLEGGRLEQRFYPALGLPEACIGGYTPQLGDADYRADPTRDFEVFSELMASYSVSPEAQRLNWSSIEQQAREELAEDMNEWDLLELFYQMIKPLKDIHTSIQTSEAFARVENKPTTVSLYLQEFIAQQGLNLPLSVDQASMANTYIMRQHERHDATILDYAENAEDVKHAANGLVRWFQVGHLGYLNIAAMTGFSELSDHEANLAVLDAALDAALSDLQDTQGLIIDVRTNGGGQDLFSLAIASRFVASKTVVYRVQAGTKNARDELLDVTIQPRGAVQYLKPISLLVSASTVSAAETFSLVMSELDQVALVGQATQGAFSDILKKTLPNGFQINLSNERYLTLNGEWLEGKGVPVDIEVPVFTQEERDGEFDYAMEAAAALLQ